METMIKAGLYSFKSPYHKNKRLPFLLHPNNTVETVEYRGWTKSSVKCHYDNPQEVIKHCNMKFELPFEDIEKLTYTKNKKRHETLLNLL